MRSKTGPRGQREPGIGSTKQTSEACSYHPRHQTQRPNRAHAELAQALGGEISGRAVLAPAPGLPADDRSLTVTLSWGAPDGFVILSRTIDRATARAHVLARLSTWRARKAQLPLFEAAP